MILICTASEAVAKLIGKAVKGRRRCATTVEAAVAAAGEDLPSVILVDARMGGSRLRAIDAVAWLMKASPLSAIVVLTYSPSVEELREIAAMGVYSWVDLNARDNADDRVRAIVSRASRVRRVEARQRRRASSVH